MKTKMILFGFVFLWGTIVLSCKDSTLFENIPVTYQKCPCDHVTTFMKTISMNNVLLFDATKTTWGDMQKLSYSDGSSTYCVYAAKTDTAILYDTHGDMTEIGYICNWPDAMKQIDISEKGTPISFSADEYEACNYPVSITTITYSNLVLKALKLRLE